jgi:hypothetical protein
MHFGSELNAPIAMKPGGRTMNIRMKSGEKKEVELFMRNHRGILFI